MAEPSPAGAAPGQPRGRPCRRQFGFPVHRASLVPPRRAGRCAEAPSPRRAWVLDTKSGNGPRISARSADAWRAWWRMCRPRPPARRTAVSLSQDAEGAEQLGEPHDAEPDLAGGVGGLFQFGERVARDVDDVVEEADRQPDRLREPPPVDVTASDEAGQVDRAQVPRPLPAVRRGRARRAFPLPRFPCRCPSRGRPGHRQLRQAARRARCRRARPALRAARKDLPHRDERTMRRVVAALEASAAPRPAMETALGDRAAGGRERAVRLLVAADAWVWIVTTDRGGVP